MLVALSMICMSQRRLSCNNLHLSTTAVPSLITMASNSNSFVKIVLKFYFSNIAAEMNIGLFQGRRSQ